MEAYKLHRRFVLQRDEDVSGVSGTGIVAQGIVFANGKVILGWCVDRPSTEQHDNIEDCINIHGHEGRTKVVWIDA